MLMKSILVLSIISGSVLAANGMTVECEAGLLSTKIKNPSGVTELVLTGCADASDFYFMEHSMPGLRLLDMSDLTILSYEGAPLGSVSYYRAGEIPRAVFAASQLESVVLPAGCSVGDLAFAGSALTDISIPDGTRVGDGAFSQCTRLTSVTIEGGVELGRGVFSSCGSLETIYGSEKIEVIPARAFEGCVSLGIFGFGAGLRSVGESAFAGSAVAEADMSACTSLDSVSSWAFAGDSSLRKAVFPDHLKKIGSGIFFECTSLSDVRLPNEMKDLPAYSFKDASAVEGSFILPDNIASVGEYALMGASSVSTIKLPSALMSIGEGAMEDMKYLSDIDALALASVPALGDEVWAGVDQKNVILNVDPLMESAFESTPQWQEFHIQGTSTSTAVPVAGEKKIRAAFDGYMLIVESIGETIDRIGLFDVAGISLYNESGLSSAQVRIDTSHSDSTVYIVDCTLSDGTRGSVKILR